MATNNRTDRPVLKVEGLCVSYGKVEALTDASITVGEGQIVTVIGPNGAGKTTMLSAIMGLLPSRGRIEFDSVAQATEAHDSPAYQEALAALGQGAERDIRIIEALT